MEGTHKLKLILGSASVAFLIIFLFITLYIYRRRRLGTIKGGSVGTGESEFQESDKGVGEDLITFLGGEDLTIYDILDAPGEVIGKSSYGTVYIANLERSCVRVLRFVRPACSGTMKEVESVIRLLGLIRHHNLVPLEAFYAGSKGEKLLVHPFFRFGNLAQFIRDGKGDSHNWDIICGISIGIARGLDHLHTGLHKPLVHGNLKSKNILIDHNLQPLVSDFGLYLLLNPAAAQEMLESSAAEGYKAPELIKMKDVSLKTDIYCLGVILLELLTGKEPISEHPSPVPDFHLPDTIRNAILNHRISDLLHPDIHLDPNHNRSHVTEECILRFFRLAMACCSPSPSVRPDIKLVLKRLEEICK